MLVKRKMIGVIGVMNFRLYKDLNPWSPGGTYMVHKKPLFLSTPGLQGLNNYCYQNSNLFFDIAFILCRTRIQTTNTKYKQGRDVVKQKTQIVFLPIG